MVGIPSSHLLFVGAGALECSLRTAAADSGISCSFAGFLNQTEIPNAYAATDCLVLPSDSGETWGLVVNEAMACGLPAIVSDRVGCREDLIVEGITGHSFPFGDIPALAGRMREMASNAGVAKHMGEEACIHGHAYSIEAAAAGVKNAIMSVAGSEKAF